VSLPHLPATDSLILLHRSTWHGPAMVERAEDPRDDKQRALGSLLVFIVLGVLGFFLFVHDRAPLVTPLAGPVAQ
jgi:hypothetical protein